MATPSISAPLAVRAAPSGPLSPPSLRFSAPSTAQSHAQRDVWGRTMRARFQFQAKGWIDRCDGAWAAGMVCMIADSRWRAPPAAAAVKFLGGPPAEQPKEFQSVSHGVSSQQAERIHCHSSLRQNTIVASENENPPLMPAIMTPGGALDLATVLLGNRVIFIGQYINSQVAQRVISQLVTLAAVDEEADILIYLNCPGGSLYSILAIYDCMSWIKPKVGTVCFGVVASQAAIILAGGEKGMRYAMPNARVMIHQPQGGSEGNVEEVRRQVGETVYARDKVDKMFAAFTGQPLDMVQQWTERDRFMSSSEAMDFGLIDGLLETRY